MKSFVWTVLVGCMVVASVKNVYGALSLETYNCHNAIYNCELISNSSDYEYWDDAALSDAHNNMIDAFYFFLHEFSRDSIDDNGLLIQSSAHFNSSYDDSYYYADGIIVFGDGDGFRHTYRSKSFDMVVHEFTHGVIDHTANFNYYKQGAAIDESFCDIMGATADRLVRYKDPANVWAVGEDLDINPASVSGIRNMADPSLFGHPNHIVEFHNTDEDYGGAHENTGIMNKAFQLMVEGGLHPLSQIYVPPLYSSFNDSIRAAANKFYYALAWRLGSDASFWDVRDATLYYANAEEEASVGAAWDAVGIRGNIPLSSGVPVNGLTLVVAKDGLWYGLDQDLYPGSSVTCQLSGGSGDADLYIDFGSQNACKSENEGCNEVCTASPVDYTTQVYIRVYAFEPFSGVTLKCDVRN